MPDVRIDTVRASRDGHQFHEAWVARCALGLLLSRNVLYAIAVEGLAEEDEDGLSSATVEIADATFYYGSGASFEACSRMELAQFKYSIAAQEKPLRVSDARKTLSKFAAAEVDFTAEHGATAVSSKLTYSLNTNRPMSDGLMEAVRAASTGAAPVSEDGKTQLEQLRATVPLAGDQLRSFASRLVLVGRMETLRDIEGGNARTIADWSASDDVLASARLGDLRQVVRDKAGSAGQRNNLIQQVDVLAALRLAQESDLLPTPQAFPEVGKIIKRAQLADFIEDIASAPRWIVHAAGGIGKTVFVQSLAAELNAQDEVVLFDCFGGGAYRTLADGRHKPERGLLHIINELACRGLCDPILPGTSDAAEVVRRSLQRFRQAIQVLRRTKSCGRLFIIIDAADNAALEAARRGQPSFPRELLESLSLQASIEGLIVIATARTERLDKAIGEAACRPLALTPFTFAESEAYISARRPDASPAHMQVVHRRAEGNPRVIANLIEPDRNLVGETQTEAKVQLESLIQERIERAVRLADQKGAHADAVSAFLCALSVLPPPVPIEEIAIAFGISPAEVESFAADLSPLLDRTRHGIIFRDEPTETLVEQQYGSQVHLLDDVAGRLTAAQSSSVYAARSLPGLLFAMGRVDELRKLAFDARFPLALAGDVAKRTIRLNRLRTALGAAAQARNYDAIVDLLVELSSVVAVDERGEDYLLAHPDLVVSLGDSEALRRLFESKTGWPGTRHARLATAYATDGDIPEAYIHAKRAEEWVRWLSGQTEQKRFHLRVETEDFVGIAAYLVASGRTTTAAQYLDHWSDAYSYEVTSRLLKICKVAHALGKLPKLGEMQTAAVRCRKLPPAIIVAMLTVFPGFDAGAGTRVLRRLAKALRDQPALTDHFPSYEKSDTYSLGLQRCSLRAAHLGLGTEAASIAAFAAPRRLGLWMLRDPFSTEHIVPWALFVAGRAAAESRAPTLFDCLPSELWDLVSGEQKPDSEAGQLTLLETKLQEKPAQTADGDKQKKPEMSESDRRQARDRLASRILPLVALTRHLTAMLCARSEAERDTALASFFEGWKAALAAARKDHYYPTETARYLDNLYSTCTLHTLIALDMFTEQAGAALAEWMQRSEFVSTHLCIDLVEHFATEQKTGALAGRIAAKALKAIAAEDDVQHRSNLMARLARALLPANRAEATALFSRGLSELDAIGSGDHSFTYELLKFASSLAAQPLRSETAHRLAKICELNAYDSRKFPWPLAAAAFSRIWGASYLAQVARWHDRGKTELELTLPCALSSLVADRFVCPEDAVALLRLVEPVESWDWRWDELVKSLIKAGPTDIAVLLDEILFQFELAHPRRPPESSLEKIRKTLERNPAELSAVNDRLERLEARASKPRRVNRDTAKQNFGGVVDPDAARKTAEEKQQQIDAAVERTDPLSTASVEALVAALDGVDGAVDAKSQAFTELRNQVAYADQRRHIEAIVSARNLKLFAKNKLLAELKADWLETSPSQLDILKSAGSRLVREHASELVGKEWGFSWELNELTQITGQPREDLAVGLVEAATTRELDTAATTWLNLASILAGRADQKAPRGALERLLDSGAARLADDVGDGPWKSTFDPGSDPTAIVSGLVWFCLGSPLAADRWRAAHAVRTLARLGRWKAIDALFDRFNAPGAGAFEGPRLRFFVMHSRQWFLLAIARIAIDFPAEIARHAKKLEAIALNEGFPHVALRETARRALLACLDGSQAAEALRRRLNEIHISKFPVSDKLVEDSSDFHWDRPTNVPEPEPRFYFDYDFDKYELAKVGNIFGLPKWDVGDRCITWIRKWDPGIEHMHDFGGRDHPHGYTSYSTGAGDSFQSYGAYLARHALALEAGRLLLTMPVNKARYTYDSWDEWLSHYSPTRRDGLWLADGTGAYPDFSLHDLKAEQSEKEQPSDEPTLLSSLAGIDTDGRMGALLTVDASWSSPDDVRVSISSVLVPPQDSDAAARALGTGPPSHMWLPAFEHYDEDEKDARRHRDMAPVEPWITPVQAELKIDEHDPCGSREAVQRDRPARHIIDAFDLRADEPWADAWRDRAGCAAFRSLAWGERKGHGENETSDSGSALQCDRAFLSELLTVLDRDLMVLVKLEHYREKPRYEASDDELGGRFSYSYSVLLVDRDLQVRRVVPTQSDFQTVESIGERSRYEFSDRLLAINRSPGRG